MASSTVRPSNHWKGDGVHTLKEARDAGILTSFRGQTANSPARSDNAKQWRCWSRGFGWFGWISA